MKLTPRPYQVDAVNSVFDYFKSSKGNPIIAMPTGTGKSVVIAMMLETIYSRYPNQRIIMITHVKELIEQNYNKLRSLWPQAPVGIYSASLNQRTYQERITFAGIASVNKKSNLFKHIDLVIIDEAHLVSTSSRTMYQKFISELKDVNPYLKVIGLTATPWRLGQGHITEEGGIFTDVCYDITGVHEFNKLIDEGYLSPLIPKRTGEQIDVSKVHIRGGEFVSAELQEAVNQEAITHSALQEVMEQGDDRAHWLIFATGIEHGNNISQMLDLMGISNVVVDSKIKKNDRDERLEQFKNGEVRAAINTNILTTGFDFPAIDLIVVLRPTASTVLWVQMLGRGTRPLYSEGFDLSTTEGRLLAIKEGPKQNCLVLDFAGNTRRLGPINDPVIPKRKGKKGGGTAPVKVCPDCSTYVPASTRHCEYCGHEFTFESNLDSQAGTGELIKSTMPLVEVFKVDHVIYSEHVKHGKAPSLKVSYYSGLRSFTEYVGFEHNLAFVTSKARKWWRERTDLPAPETTERALELTQGKAIAEPTHIRVWVNKKYPEVMAVCFDGSGFETAEN